MRKLATIIATGALVLSAIVSPIGMKFAKAETDVPKLDVLYVADSPAVGTLDLDSNVPEELTKENEYTINIDHTTVDVFNQDANSLGGDLQKYSHEKVNDNYEIVLFSSNEQQSLLTKNAQNSLLEIEDEGRIVTTQDQLSLNDGSEESFARALFSLYSSPILNSKLIFENGAKVFNVVDGVKVPANSTGVLSFNVSGLDINKVVVEESIGGNTDSANNDASFSKMATTVKNQTISSTFKTKSGGVKRFKIKYENETLLEFKIKPRKNSKDSVNNEIEIDRWADREIVKVEEIVNITYEVNIASFASNDKNNKGSIKKDTAKIEETIPNGVTVKDVLDEQGVKQPYTLSGNKLTIPIQENNSVYKLRLQMNSIGDKAFNDSKLSYDYFYNNGNNKTESASVSFQNIIIKVYDDSTGTDSTGSQLSLYVGQKPQPLKIPSNWAVLTDINYNSELINITNGNITANKSNENGSIITLGGYILSGNTYIPAIHQIKVIAKQPTVNVSPTDGFKLRVNNTLQFKASLKDGQTSIEENIMNPIIWDVSNTQIGSINKDSGLFGSSNQPNSVNVIAKVQGVESMLNKMVNVDIWDMKVKPNAIYSMDGGTSTFLNSIITNGVQFEGNISISDFESITPAFSSNTLTYSNGQVIAKQIGSTDETLKMSLTFKYVKDGITKIDTLDNIPIIIKGKTEKPIDPTTPDPTKKPWY